jgi:hypothetical protein
MVALHARRAAVVITTESAVIASKPSLLKTWISEALLRSYFAAIKALGPGIAESSGLAAANTAVPRPSKPASHVAIAIGNAQAVIRIMRPDRMA